MAKDRYLNAIQKKCLECSGGVQAEVERCPLKSCPLHPYRMGDDQYSLPGKKPDRKRE